MPFPQQCAMDQRDAQALIQIFISAKASRLSVTIKEAG
jgi:hypothetical protein